MIARVRQLSVACMAAISLLATGGPLQAQQKPSWKPGRSVPWSASRSQAVVADPDSSQAVGTGVTQTAAEETIVAEELPSGRKLSVQRPARLAPRVSYTRQPTESVLSAPDEVITEEPGVYAGHSTMDGAYGGEACFGCGGYDCPGGCCGNWRSCGPVAPYCLLPCPQNLELFAGVHGFTGPANRGGSGSFGFHEGFNNAIPLCCSPVCWQIGAQWTQSNYDGSVLEDQERTQIFLTTGVFRRAECGLQWGLMYDYLHDEWDYEVDLGQLRGEAGWRMGCRNEVGFWFTAGLDEVDASSTEAVIEGDSIRLIESERQWEVNDLYAFYFRRDFVCGGQGRLFGGFTAEGQGLFGGDARLPLNPCWSLQTDFMYLIPHDGDNETIPGFIEETWNVSISVVWTPFAKPGCGPSHCRPLLNVANNGTFATTLR